jgi:transketolase
VFEALLAYEELRSQGIAIRVIDLFSVQPIDRAALLASADVAQGNIVTVEDHYAHGGIGDCVLAALAPTPVRLVKLAVGAVARSGKPNELLAHYGISAAHIVRAVRGLVR